MELGRAVKARVEEAAGERREGLAYVDARDEVA
jgi:hypothetical protein